MKRLLLALIIFSFIINLSLSISQQPQDIQEEKGEVIELTNGRIVTVQN